MLVVKWLEGIHVLSCTELFSTFQADFIPELQQKRVKFVIYLIYYTSICLLFLYRRKNHSMVSITFDIATKPYDML